MSVSVCIASRGRPGLLYTTVRRLTDGMALDDTAISVALDEDDTELPQYHTWYSETDRFRASFSIAPREDALGAKYNRAQMARPADLYVLWADDMIAPEHGWDKKLTDAAARIQDGCGAVLFGDIPGILQPGLAFTHKFVEAMGFFCVPYFPAWWHDTWPLEIATMADRIVRADVKVELLQDVKGASRGIREISFWAELFDRLRPTRQAVAERIIDEGSELPSRKAFLKARFPDLEVAFLQSNSVCRDPTSAARLEAHYSFDAPADERYMRLKAKAELMLAGLRDTQTGQVA